MNMIRSSAARAPLLWAALGLFVAGCGPSAAPPGQLPPPVVVVNQPLEREVMEWDEYQARLDAVEMVEIRARVTGYLQSVNFKDGAEIQKGDLLFVIDPRPYQADADRAAAELNQAESRLELAKNEQARAERLLKSKAISEEEADTRSKARREAEAALQSARASVETAKLNLEYTRITAPISGRIGRRLVTEGNLVNGSLGVSSLLATIVSLDPIYAYFDADESSILKYQQLAREGKGDSLRDGKVVCQLELANETGFPHHGLLDFVDNRVDATTGTLRVRAIFSNPGPDRLLQPGYFTRVRVPGTAKASALLIPDLAVGTDQGQKYVLLVNSANTVEYRTVKLGPIFEGLRVVRGGLKSSDWVVVNGLMSAIPGVTVNPTRAALTNAPEAVAAGRP
jgi:RND family efflux transporter MFP subunit